MCLELCIVHVYWKVGMHWSFRYACALKMIEKCPKRASFLFLQPNKDVVASVFGAWHKIECRERMIKLMNGTLCFLLNPNETVY